MLPEVPPEEEVGLLLAAGSEALYRLTNLRVRIAGKLAAAAEEAEADHALPRAADGAEMVNVES